MLNIYISKLCVLLLLTVCRLVSGLCPLLISRKFKRKCGFDRVSKSWVEKAVGFSMDFSGGLLLATCFIHMIPEVREHLVEVLQRDYRFPYAETLVCVGFFIVFVIEESVKQVSEHRTTTTASSHQLLSKSGAFISAKGCQSRATGVDAAATAAACRRDDGEGETSPMSVDLNAAENGAGATNGVSGSTCGGGDGSGSGVTAGAAGKLMLEMNSMMMKEELGLGECNNNTRSRQHEHAMKNILLVSALSFHSVMEGLAIGLALDVQDVWYLFFAVTVHECTILLCVGIEIVTSCTSVIAVVAYMAIFALVSPAGVLFGTLLTLSMSELHSSPFQSVIVSSLQGLAAGTILYVTFFEVLNNHKHHHSHHHGKSHQSKSSIPQLMFILLGFLFMVFLELIGGHEESHFEYQSHDHLSNVSSH